MNYADASAALYARTGELTVHRKFELQHMRTLLTALGNPQRQFPSVLIAGTNGKGSTAATLASIGAASGLKTGLYTSPHLARVNERIRNSGAEISDDDLANAFAQVDEAAKSLVASADLPYPPSFFEVLTAMAFVHFAALRVDIAILEVGLGGRLDATNVVEPKVSVITDIALDHQEWLGPTLTHIAREKAGILRRGGVLVTLPQHAEVNQALGEIAAPLEVRGISAAEYVPPTSRDATWRNCYQLAVLGEEIEVDSPLNGEHQRRNIALAIAAAVALRERGGVFSEITAGSIAQGIRATVWPGRLELLRGGRVLLDVAHNPAGAWALRAALSTWQREAGIDLERGTLLFACLRDKAAEEMAQILFPLFGSVLLTQVSAPRAMPAEELAALVGKYAREFRTEPDAVRAAQSAAEKGPAVIAGSVYLVGAVRGPLME